MQEETLLFFNGSRISEKNVIPSPNKKVSENLKERTVSVCWAIMAETIRTPADNRKIPILLRFVLKKLCEVRLMVFNIILFSAYFAQLFLKPRDLNFTPDIFEIMPDVLLPVQADSILLYDVKRDTKKLLCIRFLI